LRRTPSIGASITSSWVATTTAFSSLLDMKRIYFVCSVLFSLLLTSCGDYDDSSIQNKLNDFKERIAALQTKADNSMNISQNWDI